MTPFLTTEEVAAALKLSKWSVYKLVAAGKLKPSRLTRRLRFSEADLEQAVRAAVAAPAESTSPVRDHL
jgi:excisionase family DNA binding protein